MGRNTMRSSINNAMRQRLFTEYLNEQETKTNNMKTTFLTGTTGKIDELNSKIEVLLNEGYVVVEFKTSPGIEEDKYNNYTVIIVQLNKTN